MSDCLSIKQSLCSIVERSTVGHSEHLIVRRGAKGEASTATKKVMVRVSGGKLSMHHPWMVAS